MAMILSSATLGVSLSWDGGATYTTEETYVINLSEYPSTELIYFGFSDPLWGRSWTKDELSNANFRCKLRLVAKSGAANGVICDYVKVTVQYQEKNIKGELALRTQQRVITN